jgi:hypothetical protein
VLRDLGGGFVHQLACRIHGMALGQLVSKMGKGEYRQKKAKQQNWFEGSEQQVVTI